MSSWAKFHETYGTSTKPQHVYGSYISDPRQYYDRSAHKRWSFITQFFSCLGCLIGRRAGGHGDRDIINTHHYRSRTPQKNVDTKYMYNRNTFEYNPVSTGNRFENRRSPTRNTRSTMFRQSRSKGNINYLQ